MPSCSILRVCVYVSEKTCVFELYSSGIQVALVGSHVLSYFASFTEGNQLTGTIPTFFSNFSSLVELRLEDNSFTGAPTGFCPPNLTDFRVDRYLDWCNCCDQ